MAAVISNPYSDAFLYRNPRNKNAGSFVALSEFLALANNATSISGVLIRIEVSLLGFLISCNTFTVKLYDLNRFQNYYDNFNNLH